MAYIDPAITHVQESDKKYSLIPDGWYAVKVTQADLVDTKTGGTMIKMRADILGPAHQGRCVFANINLRNASEDAERIGRELLDSLRVAIGLPRVDDTDQLIGATALAKVVIKPASGEWEASNNVKMFKQLASNPPLAAPGMIPALQPTAPIPAYAPPQAQAQPQQAAYTPPAPQYQQPAYAPPPQQAQPAAAPGFAAPWATQGK